MSKFDSLKPVLNILESQLVSHGLHQIIAEGIVLGQTGSAHFSFLKYFYPDIAERLVTAGYGWDKILNYHSKVRQ